MTKNVIPTSFIACRSVTHCDSDHVAVTGVMSRKTPLRCGFMMARGPRLRTMAPVAALPLPLLVSAGAAAPTDFAPATVLAAVAMAICGISATAATATGSTHTMMAAAALRMWQALSCCGGDSHSSVHVASATPGAATARCALQLPLYRDSSDETRPPVHWQHWQAVLLQC